jgi:hypothetical protein
LQILKIFAASLLIASSLSYQASATSGLTDLNQTKSSKVGISFENKDKTFVLTFGEIFDDTPHTVIDIDRINDLEYKTRVMRYFGGMLKNNTYKFRNIIVITDDNEFKMDFNRENVSLIVNAMIKSRN